jgi:hypothetical protein
MFAGSAGGNNPIGTVGLSYNSGSSWSTTVGEEAAFRVNGIAIPEPASLSLLSLGFLALLGWRGNRIA